jgi:uncharacterized Zn finger protein
MKLPYISESSLQSYANANSLSRGREYFRSGAVADVTQRGSQVQANVEGSDFEPYCVSIELDTDGITSAHCTCPYDYDGWCKHIVATVLTCIHNPKTITDRPTLAQLLDRLDPLQTQRLIKSLVSDHPRLIDDIDRHISCLAVTPPPAKKSAKPPAAIDTQPFRRQVKQIIREGLRYVEDGYDDDPTSEALQDVIAQAQEFIEQGQPASALIILEAIADALTQDWDDLSEYGLDSDEVTTALDEALTAAILSGELAAEQKTDLLVMLTEWQETLGSLEISQAALEQGWDYPPLQRVLQGEMTEQGAWDGESPNYADDLALIRLQILDRQGRDQEYLYLAEAEGQTVPYFNKLVELGEIDTVMDTADELITTPEEAFAIAQTLREERWDTQALAIAQAGLLLPIDADLRRFNLAIWTSDLAAELGETQTALEARIVAFKAQPSFRDYRQIADLAGSDWSKLRPDLIQALQRYQRWGAEQAKVDIFLHEGMVEDAIRSISIRSSAGLIQRVMEAAIPIQPQWVIEWGKELAEPIMDQKRADRYQEAVNWLKQVRLGYLQLGQKAQWAEYRSELVQVHARKSKLMKLITQVGIG